MCMKCGRMREYLNAEVVEHEFSKALPLQSEGLWLVLSEVSVDNDYTQPVEQVILQPVISLMNVVSAKLSPLYHIDGRHDTCKVTR